jgi:adenosine deaminase
MNKTKDPKIELHLHLEGGAPPSFIRQLSEEKSIYIKGIFDEDGHYLFRDFTHFLSVYEAATSVLTSPTDFYRLTKAVLEQSAENGVIYTEAFLSPDFCGGADVTAWRDYLAAIEDAASEAEKEWGITMRGIVTSIRHFGPEQAKSAALCAAETAGDFIRGFGMGGDETIGTQGDYAFSFDLAREAGLKLTTHAGEWGGAESVRQAITDLNVERLGHGVQVLEDPALVQEVIERDITLEVCPGSNVALSIFSNVKSHPIASLRKKGVKVTVSTDDPPFFHTTMCREYELLTDAFNWGDRDFKELNRTAIDAAFCSDETKARLLKELETE